MPDTEPLPVCAGCGATTRTTWRPAWECWLCVNCAEERADSEVRRAMLPAEDWHRIMSAPLTGEFAL